MVSEELRFQQTEGEKQTNKQLNVDQEKRTSEDGGDVCDILTVRANTRNNIYSGVTLSKKINNVS